MTTAGGGCLPGQILFGFAQGTWAREPRVRELLYVPLTILSMDGNILLPYCSHTKTSISLRPLILSTSYPSYFHENSEKLIFLEIKKMVIPQKATGIAKESLPRLVPNNHIVFGEEKFSYWRMRSSIVATGFATCHAQFPGGRSPPRYFEYVERYE
ncbi:hypothetical protein EVAR_9318_1 [Eumeta japonica]|uniref:Uncharacterized protein n=1 Tax=Eumeta variegata TaxID=151549 RepID=A0A4C1TLZ9_EUMVA|nr:hypothetical protein EVAR_9318_1 [Eumeta japonica]